MLHFENNFNARFYVWSVYSKKINLKLWTLVYSVNSPSPKPSSFPVLLKRFVSSPRIFSNQAFNRTTILHLLGCSSVLKNSENGQYVHLGPLLMYKKEIYSSGKIFDLFHVHSVTEFRGRHCSGVPWYWISNAKAHQLTLKVNTNEFWRCVNALNRIIRGSWSLWSSWPHSEELQEGISLFAST